MLIKGKKYGFWFESTIIFWLKIGSQIFKWDFEKKAAYELFLSIFRVEEYVRKQLEGTDVKIEVIKGHETLKKEYPCFAAVDRCANQLENQRGCVIWLTYEPKGK